MKWKNPERADIISQCNFKEKTAYNFIDFVDVIPEFRVNEGKADIVILVAVLLM